MIEQVTVERVCQRKWSAKSDKESAQITEERPGQFELQNVYSILTIGRLKLLHAVLSELLTDVAEETFQTTNQE